jgi:hypothetical protein
MQSLKGAKILANAGVGILAGSALGASVMAALLWPAAAPIVVLLWLGSSIWVLGKAHTAARGTALGGAVLWMVGAVVIVIAGQVLALREPVATGRPWCGHATYLASLAAIAALISVFNARRPGARAWALLMGLLVVVLLIPWLEGAGLTVSSDSMRRLRLGSPWSLFFLTLSIAGVVNYLPTRYGTSALLAGLGLGLECAGLTWTDLDASWRGRIWSLVPLFFAASIWAGFSSARQVRPAESDLERLWFWFRDHWGVVWSLRILERYNRSAEQAHLEARLGWGGAERRWISGTVETQATSLLAGLLRRFADPERIGREAVGRAP